MPKKKTYTEESIKSISPLEFTRLRPGVYCGSTEYSNQLLREIIANSLDEYTIGNCNQIKIKTLPDNFYQVEDNGQGFLINSVREDGKTILEASFSVVNTSGKYSNDGVYEGTSLGLNGLGSKISNFLSHSFEVLSWRDGKYERIRFNEGIFEKREVGQWTDKNKPSGTLCKWQPSEEFFQNPQIQEKEIKEWLSAIVCLCPDLTIFFNEEELKSERGLNDYLELKLKGEEILSNRFSVNKSFGKSKIDLILTYSSDYSATIIPYVNLGLTEQGPHLTQLKALITRELNKFFREKGWLKEKEANLSGEDCQEGMTLIFNITTTNVKYDAQTKTRIVELNMGDFISFVGEAFNDWLNANEKEIKLIADKALQARRAREAARKAKEAIREGKDKKGLRGKVSLSKKFIDCSNKNPSERNLLLVEGLSAGSSAIEARKTASDAIYMLKGKTVSPLKTTKDKLLQNQEMSEIVKIIGAGFDDNFDVNKMNFNKIVIVSDADSDGFSIELLLITFFYTYMRPLIEAGKLYRAITPLYIVRKGKEELYFYTEEEMNEWRTKQLTGWDVIRAKG